MLSTFFKSPSVAQGTDKACKQDAFVKLKFQSASMRSARLVREPTLITRRPLTRRGLAFSQPSKGLATPPNLGGQYRDLDNSYIIAWHYVRSSGRTTRGQPGLSPLKRWDTADYSIQGQPDNLFRQSALKLRQFSGKVLPIIILKICKPCHSET